MNNHSLAQLNDVFQRIPLLADYTTKDFEVIQLAGMSNKSYRLKNTKHDLILRIPQSQTDYYIDRNTEAYNSDIAARLGLSPECLWRNKSGESLTQTIQQCKPLSHSDLQENSIMKLVADRLSHLHNSQRPFNGEVNLKQLLKRYFDKLDEQQQNKLRQRYRSALNKLQTVPSSDIQPVPSHNDLNENNLLLDTNNNLWFIDWEHSSMASPYWDLATICNSANYQDSHCTQLLAFYTTSDHQLELELETLLDYREILSVMNDCWMNVFVTEPAKLSPSLSAADKI